MVVSLNSRLESNNEGSEYRVELDVSDVELALKDPGSKSRVRYTALS